MDRFFEECSLDDIFSWYDIEPVLNQSAFQPFSSIPITENIDNSSGCNETKTNNVNKRMVEFMKRSVALNVENQESESTRCFRRKMSERLRREKEKKGYLALHSILPRGTKNDKNSIMKVASKTIQELKAYKEMLERRNDELELKLEAINNNNNMMRTTKIEFKIAHPITSGMIYMVEVLKCLNSLGSKIINIQSNFSNQQIAAAMDIETQISDGEVRMEVERTLEEVQRKLQFQEDYSFITIK